MVFGRSPVTMPNTLTSLMWAVRNMGKLSPGRIRHWHVRRKLKLAGSRMDAGECTADPCPVVLLWLLRGQLQDRMSDWLGLLDDVFEVAREISNRLTAIFLRDKCGRRPSAGGTEKFQTDPHWKDYILFYEYFHGDNGAGLELHQTGWTGLVAKLIELFGRLDGAQLLDAGKAGAFAKKNQHGISRSRERIRGLRLFFGIRVAGGQMRRKDNGGKEAYHPMLEAVGDQRPYG